MCALMGRRLADGGRRLGHTCKWQAEGGEKAAFISFDLSYVEKTSCGISVKEGRLAAISLGPAG